VPEAHPDHALVNVATFEQAYLVDVAALFVLVNVQHQGLARVRDFALGKPDDLLRVVRRVRRSVCQ